MYANNYLGMVQYETAMELTKFLGEETDHVVWMTVVTALDKIVTAEFSTGGALETFKVNGTKSKFMLAIGVLRNYESTGCLT